MHRLATGLGTGGLLALALAASPAAPALAGPSSTPATGERRIVTSVVHDRDGATHVRYERTWNGLRVIGGDLVSHRNAKGAVTGVTYNHGRVLVVPPTSTPTISKSAARSAGLAASQARQEQASPAEVVVFLTDRGARLAYEVVTEGIRADQTPSRLHTIVDATTGATLQSWDDIKTGTGHGIFVGTVPLGTTAGSGSYTLEDAHGNYTTDLRNRRSGSGTTFTDADDVWGDGSQSNRQSAGVDAHYGAEKTYDYYDTVLGRAGIWDNGQGARSRVHYGNSYVNAFWDGTQMTYGDGANNQHPLVELDVAGHEMSHGVTENTANLDYSGEAGGLNEATSDIFGTAVEWYADNASDTPDFLIGEEIDINGDGTPLRYLDKPSKDGASKDCWSGSLGSLDPHYSSGPLNHWYFLASNGSGARTINGVGYNSPTCNGASVTGIGHEKVEKIWYRALSRYLTSSSDYAAARNASIKAAKDLYGTDSAECTAVAGAFSAISVAAGSETCGNTPPPPPPSGDSWVTNGGFESGQTGWTGTSGPITDNAGRAAHSGSWKMWLGGNGRRATETEQQAFTVPSSAANPTLTYWIRIDTDEYSTRYAYDTMKVSLNGTNVKSYSNLSANGSYAKVSVDLSGYKGTSVTLKFTMQEDRSFQTSFVVDDVSAQG
ncbi:MAG: M4 family metallopeptidase [Intrasporangium sp.]|uniref:M4 family metallopeptidase n=1 Tax=Intrasporangium sp. TaxID=1925024 RepID=UPI002647E1F9|nr:M4 family metallopeptidase [Intrasporangium sp.]MDN5795613.1 M4 family metallopeptidase [Intrasporangium sp.]